MKTKITLAVSLLINVALAVLMIRGRGHQRADIVLTESTASVTSTTDVSGVARVVEPRSHNSTASHEPERVASPDPISNIWKQVAVSDYQQFAENLRALGVPEETVRDIVMMDLIKTLGEDMMTLSRRAEKPFWQAQSFGAKGASVSNEVAQSLLQLNALTKRVLGIEPGTWIADHWGWVMTVGSNGESDQFAPLEEMFAQFDNAQEFSWLVPDRSRELQHMIAANEKAREEIEDKMSFLDSDSSESKALEIQLSKLVEDGKMQIDSFLTPGERRERDLREDSSLQQQLAGVEVTRAEYEKLHDLAKSVGATEPPYFKPNTPEAAQAIGILGAERFAEFQRGADARYGQILQSCASYDLPHQTSQKVYEVGLAHDQRFAAGDGNADERLEQLKRELKELVPDASQRESLANTINSYFGHHLRTFQ